MIEINRVIKEFSSFEKRIDSLIGELRMLLLNDKKLFEKLEHVDQGYVMSSKFVHFMADAMQLSDSEEIFSSFHLKDVEHIYDILLLHYPDDLGIWMDAIYFNSRVMDNIPKSNYLLVELKNKISLVSIEIEKIEKEIE